MKYVIKRTSCGYGEKPHKDANSETITDYVYRACSRETLRDKWLYSDWEEYEPYKRGCRKRVEYQFWTLENRRLVSVCG